MDVNSLLENIPYNDSRDFGVMHVSKWQHFHLKLSLEGLSSLFDALSLHHAYLVGQLCTRDACIESLSRFTTTYAQFLQAEEENKTAFRKALTVGLSQDPSVFSLKRLASGVIVTPHLPYIQVRLSTYTVSDDCKVHPGTLGSNAAPWGLQFSYPLLFMNEKEGIGKNVLTEEGFVNTPLYKKMQKWIREMTKPAKVLVDGSLVQTTLRSMR